MWKSGIFSICHWLLRQVRRAAHLLDIHVYSLQEMLSRSSLETQKLELMSAMSELKLQQAALERENLELRTNHLNNNLVNGNAGHNGSTGSIIRRPPLAPTRLLSTTSSSGSTPSPNVVGGGLGSNGHPLGGSHGNLQQSSNGTPKVRNNGESSILHKTRL